MTERPDITDALKGLLDVTRVAMTAGAEIPTDEAAELLLRLLPIVERSMPADLQAQDARVMKAQMVLKSMRQ